MVQKLATGREVFQGNMLDVFEHVPLVIFVGKLRLRFFMGKSWDNHGKMVIYMENQHHFEWVNQLFGWWFQT